MGGSGVAVRTQNIQSIPEGVSQSILEGRQLMVYKPAEFFQAQNIAKQNRQTLKQFSKIPGGKKYSHFSSVDKNLYNKILCLETEIVAMEMSSFHDCIFVS